MHIHNNRLNSGFLVAFLLLVSIVFVSGQSVDIAPSEISVKAYAGDFAESLLTITNNGNEIILVEVSSISWEIKNIIPEIEKGYVRIAPNGTGYLRVKGYINKESKPGFYKGDVIVNVNGKERTIALKLEVLVVVTEVSLDLNIELDRIESKPGGTVVVRSKISNLVQRRTETSLELIMKDLETGAILVKKESGIILPENVVLETSTELIIPKEIQDKEYEISGTIYYTGNGNRTAKMSDTERIIVRRSILDMLDPIISEITGARVILGFFLLIVLGILMSFYRRYKKERQIRKRYLESIKFDTLPHKGPKSGYVGKIAEMNADAYLYLDSLSSHTLMAGTTGCGKTLSAQVLVEEALLKSGVSVIVFDPTAQWTGFLEPNKDEEMFKSYGKYKMKRADAKAFKGNVYVIKDATQRINPKQHITPGEISVFYMRELNNPDIEVFISNAIDDIFGAKLGDNPKLKVLLVFDEIHRILPKFGGVGKGFVQIEKAVREFRRFGIGVILISQVLKDFVGQIKANIGTEIQMQTRYKEDLDRINLKYGGYIYQSVVKANVGEGMLQNSEYNKGNPYFVSFRPVLHNANSMSNEKLEQYAKYNEKVNQLMPKLETLRKAELDIFDIELEMKLALDNIKGGSFGIVDLYVDSLSERIDDYVERLKTGKISEEERAIKSEWDARRDEEIKAYERELSAILDKEEKRIEEREKILRQKQEETMRKIEQEKEKLREDEEKIMVELEAEEIKLKSRAQVLELLKKHKEIKILREEVALKEKEKLRIGEEKLKELGDMKKTQLDEERRKQADEEQRLREETQKREDALKKAEKMIGQRREMITRDKDIILQMDEEIGAKEEKVAQKMVGEIQGGIEKRKDILGQVAVEENATRKEGLKKSDDELQKRLDAERTQSKSQVREERKELVNEKDKLHNELKEMKDKWKGIIEREVVITELEGKKEELGDKKPKKGDAGWDDFKNMENEWKKMDEMRAEKEALEMELAKIRGDLQSGITTPSTAAAAKNGSAPDVAPKPEEAKPEGVEVPAEKIQELRTKRREIEQEIEAEKKKISELEGKGEGWEIFEKMEQEWKRMDELR
ncbi:MAG: DUF853 family protein, partial [Candidatus Altiarchaeota archaeon]|nr:DUF853 family protein [Candidatus Altiarchaeota archaeon]